MNWTDFNDEQKRALVNLLVMGMYADGNLDLIEDERARRVLNTIRFSNESARQQFLDASFARARKHNVSAEMQRKYIAEIAKLFPATAERREVYTTLEDSLSSDNSIAEGECDLLTIVGDEFKF